MTKRAPFKKAIWILICIGALTAASYYVYRNFFTTKEKQSDYQEIKAQRHEINVTVLSTGVVKPENRLDIKPPIAGRVDTILVDEGDTVRTGQTLAWMSSTERAGHMDSASAKGKEVVAEWEKLFKPTPILAPIAGTIIKRHVVAGQTFSPGDAVYTMSDRLTVSAQVDETDIGKIELSQRALITLDAYPDIHTLGEVKKIAFDATTVNNVTTYVVDVTPESIPKVMRSGMTANVTFEVETKSNIIAIPVGAVKVVEGQSFVRLPSKEPTKDPVEKLIRTGITDGKKIEVVEGLTDGEVFLAPEFRLKDFDGSGNPFSPFGSRPSKVKPTK